jgi:hypothetical protein
MHVQHPLPLIADAKSTIEGGIGFKITSLCAEFDQQILNFKTSFITASRAVGDGVGNLEVQSAGWAAAFKNE